MQGGLQRKPPMSALRKANVQLPLFSEPAQYHAAGGWGFFSLLTRPEGGKATQSSHRLDLMPKVISLVNPNVDTWLSQAEFAKPNRRVVNLARIGLLFCDLDTYKEPFSQGKSPEMLAAGLLHYCDQEGIPAPSLIVFSGRGLQAKWLLEGTIPRQALTRWNACQRHLVDKLKPLGADPAAKDASRVLRLVDTVNTKSGQMCHVVHITSGHDGKPMRYGFEYLCESLLPVARWDIRDHQTHQAKLKIIQGGKVKNGLRGFSGRTLAWHRLDDLRKLAEIRGGVQEGQRMQHLFWQLNFLMLSGASNSNLMWHEAAEIARQIDTSWGYRTPELSTLYQKACAHEKGEKVSFNGKEYSPLYTPKNDTLINLFGITSDEERQMRTLISEGMAKERHAKREESRRRAAGAMERAKYEANSISKTKPWEALGMSRRTWYRAGKPTAEAGTGPCVLQADKT